MTYKLPEGWKEVELQSIAKYINDKVTIENCKVDSYITTTNMIQNKGGIVESDNLPKANSVNSFKSGDILVSNIRPYFKKIWFATFDGTSSTDVLIFRGEEYIHNKFLYYVLANDSFFDYTTKSAKGTKMPRGDKKAIMNYLVPELSLPEQKVIADTLSALDDKIELNNKINENLEEQAQAIFKHWFIDFEFPDENGNPYKSSGGEMIESELGMIPKGWEVMSIEDMTTLSHTGGDAIRKVPIVDYNTGVKCARVGDLSQNRPISEWAYCKANDENFKKYKLEKGDVLVTRTASLGLNKMINKSENAVFNNGLIRLRFRPEYELSYIKYIFDNNQFMNYINMITGDSSTRPNMKIKYLLSYKIALAPNYLQEKYQQVINPIINKIQLNIDQNQKLSQLRDTLLPKLMSGEIRIPLE